MFIKVDVKPNSSEDTVHKIGKDHFMVRVSASASKGKANKAVLKLLKKYFGNQVFLVSGHTSRRKIFEVEE